VFVFLKHPEVSIYIIKGSKVGIWKVCWKVCAKTQTSKAMCIMNNYFSVENQLFKPHAACCARPLLFFHGRCVVLELHLADMGPVHTTMQRNAAQKYEQVK
jgi:hypothetical protein